MRMLAIDIVLLPPDALAESAIALNRALSGVPNPPITLSRGPCLPHVSLAMACINECDVPALANLIAEASVSHPPIDLIPAAFHVRQSQTGFVVASIELDRSAPLQALHERVMRRLEPFVGRSATSEMFMDADAIPPSTIRWVNEYASAASFDRFWPHITLGMGSLPESAQLPAGGSASRLALCHLGPHCTCRRVLAESLLCGG